MDMLKLIHVYRFNSNLKWVTCPHFRTEVIVTTETEKKHLGIGFEILDSSSYNNTGWPNKNGTVDTVDFQDFALINSYLFSPCWIEHLFLIIITPRSSNLVQKLLFYE